MKIYNKIIVFGIGILIILFLFQYILFKGGFMNREKYEQILKKANEMSEKKNYEKAEKLLKKSIKYDIEGYYQLGIFYFSELNDEKRAIKFFELGYKKGYILSTLPLGDIYREKGNVEKAKEWYQKGVEENENSCNIQLAKIYMSEKNFNEAEKILLEVENIEKNGEAIYNLFIISYLKNDKKNMDKWENKLFNETLVEDINGDMINNIKYIKGSDKDKKFFNQINDANNFAFLGNYNIAENKLKDAIKINEKDGYYELGKLYYYILKKDLAKKILEKSYELGNFQSLSIIGRIEEDNEKIEKAKEIYKIGVEKEDRESIFNLGAIYEEEDNDIENAIIIYNKGMALKDARSIYNLVHIYEKLGEEEEVKKLKNKILFEKGLIYLEYDMINYAKK